MKMIVIMNHNLTEEQKVDAKKTFGVDEFVTMPEELKKTWMNVDPEWSFYNIGKYVTAPVINFIKGQTNLQEAYSSQIIVLVAGEPNATFNLVSKLLDEKIPCVSATTKRVSVEETMPDGSVVKKNIFKHVQFREFIG